MIVDVVWSGAPVSRAVVVVGAWDPFRSWHRALLTDLGRRASDRDCGGVAVLLDPDPASAGGYGKRYGPAGWPIYDDVRARIAMMLDAGLDAVLTVTLAGEDFSASAATFLGAVSSRVRIEELWLGALQQLGPGNPGGADAIRSYAGDQGFAVVTLPRSPIPVYDARGLLAAGKVMAAAREVGRPPTWSRPDDSVLHLPWRPGRYRAVELPAPGCIATSPTCELVMEAAADGGAELEWPASEPPFLAFVAGPQDYSANR